MSLQHQPDISEIVQKLDAEPLNHLMLGNRELFHSNLLAWFFRFLPDEADNVFGRLTRGRNTVGDGDSRKVHREKNHLDLVFYWPNRYPLIIENKVFSLPDEEQLRKYVVEKHIGEATLYLLSLANPNWKDNHREIEGYRWHWLSFQELGKRIQSAVPVNDYSYQLETMRRYAGVSLLLHELAARVTSSGETVRLPHDVRSALADNRLISAMAKLRASVVGQCITQALHEARATKNVMVDFTRVEPLIEWFCSVSADWQAGWQLQGVQFKLAIRKKDKEGTEREHKEFAGTSDNANFFDFDNIIPIIGTTSEIYPLKGGFNYYKPAARPSGVPYVYRYVNVPNLTINQLKAAAITIARGLKPCQQR
jgi:hypothetical protein